MPLELIDIPEKVGLSGNMTGRAEKPISSEETLILYLGEGREPVSTTVAEFFLFCKGCTNPVKIVQNEGAIFFERVKALFGEELNAELIGDPSILQLVLQVEVPLSGCPLKSERRAWAVDREIYPRNVYLVAPVIYGMELRIARLLAETSKRGVRVEVGAFQETEREIIVRREVLNLEICVALNRDPHTFKVSSPAQLAGALYNPVDAKPIPQETKKSVARVAAELPGLGLKCPQRKISVASDVILKLKHPVIKLLLEFKNLEAILTRDFPNVREFINGGRLHPKFLPLGSDGTSRIYTEDPNLIGLSKYTRKFIAPDPERVFCVMDYISAELIIMSGMSGEKSVTDLLDAGIDPHKDILSRVTGKPFDSITEEERDIGKALNYAPLYGQEVWGFAERVGISTQQAAKFLMHFWHQRPNLEQWIRSREQRSRETGQTETAVGRRRLLPGLSSPEAGQVKKALRQSVNTAIQGSCADIIKLGMLSMVDSPDQRLKEHRVRIECPVFDAVLLSFDRTVLPFREEVEETLRGIYNIPIGGTRMRAKFWWSEKSWADCKG